MISTVLRAIALAAAAGQRMMTPAAALSWAAVSGRVTPAPWPFRLLRRPWVMNLLWVCALGEVIADKLPFTPTRTDPGPLAARVAAGAGVSAAFFSANDLAPWKGALLGGAIAGVQTFAGHSLRMRLNRSFPNPLSGVVGDVLAVSYALAAVAPKKRRWIW